MGDGSDAGDEILLLVVDDMVEAMRLGEFDLVGELAVPDRRTEMLGPLSQDQSTHRRPHETGSCRPLTLKVRRNRYSAVMPFNIMAAACSSLMPSGTFTTRSASITLFGIGADMHGVSDAVARLQPVDFRADLQNDPAASCPGSKEIPRRRIEARAMIDVDEVQADRGMPDQDLSAPGCPGAASS
jgi:hypothetical protein